MNGFDIFLVILLAFGAYRGFSKGIIAMAAQVIALLAGALCSRTFGDTVCAWFNPVPAFAVKSIVNVVLFGVGYAVVMSMGRLVREIFHALFLGFFDRVLGALFCMVEVGLAISLALNLWAIVVPSSVPGPENPFRAVLFDLAPVVLGYL